MSDYIEPIYYQESIVSSDGTCNLKIETPVCPENECECFSAEQLQWGSLLSRFDFDFIYTVSIIVDIIFLASYIPGIYSEWYNGLVLTTLNPWIPRVLWVVSIIISYIGLYFLWKDIKSENDLQRAMGVSVLFMISTFILILWSIILYQGHNIGSSVWVAFVLFIYQFWLFIYIFNINMVAGILMVPVTIMYGYLLFSSIELANLNGVPL